MDQHRCPHCKITPFPETDALQKGWYIATFATLNTSATIVGTERKIVCPECWEKLTTPVETQP